MGAYLVGVPVSTPDSTDTLEDPVVQALLAQEGHELFDYLTSIRQRRCANCGDRASVVRLSLDERKRQYLCGSCGRFL
jgi:hypothetical protein